MVSLQITVYTKDDCGDCARTKKLLAQKGIPHETKHVAEDNAELIASLRAISDAKGIPLGMPMVEVTNLDLGETEQWFGHRPDMVLQHIINPTRGRG